MRSTFIRLPLLFAVVMLVGFLFYQYIMNFTGDGKDSPEEALPTDHDYEWIEGPNSEDEVRYFFLADDNYFGTGIVRKNLKGWTSGNGAYSKLPKLEDNKINSAYSDQKILFGIVRKTEDIKVVVNNEKAKLLSLDSLSKDILEKYEVENCYIWYIPIDELKEKETYIIHVLGENDNIISELII